MCNAIKLRESEKILDSLKNRWFGFRTLDALVELMRAECSLSAEELAKCMTQTARFNAKNNDLANFLVFYFLSKR